MKATAGAIEFLVDRLHVSTSDRSVVREFRNRIKRGNPQGLSFENRSDRKEIYTLALSRHSLNRKMYGAVMGGRI